MDVHSPWDRPKLYHGGCEPRDGMGGTSSEWQAHKQENSQESCLRIEVSLLCLALKREL